MDDEVVEVSQVFNKGDSVEAAEKFCHQVYMAKY